MLEAALTLLTGIVIAVVSAWTTVQLSLQKFRSERWWERKVQAYERVIAALHDAKAFADDHMEAAMRGKELPEEQDKELRARSKLANKEIVKAIDMGAFLLSDEAQSRLKQYLRDKRKKPEIPGWYDYLEVIWEATDNCLKDLILIAKRDLLIK